MPWVDNSFLPYMKTALVSGGCGFIGSHLCDKLIKDEFKVICLDNLITGSENNIRQLLKNKNFQFIKHNVTEDLTHDIGDVHYVFHLASPASPNHHSKISYHALGLETMMVNTIGTLKMLEIAEHNKARFLFSSSSEIYGDPLEHPQSEDYKGNTSTIGPRSVYDESKRFGETITSFFQRKRNVDTRIARIFNTFGPRMQKQDKRMIVNFILQALAHESITIYGDGSQTRSLCYVDDLVEGLMRLMFTNKLSENVINLGNPIEHTVAEYAHMVKELTHSKSTIIMSESLPQDDPKKRKPDIERAKNLLDWTPTVSLKTGLKKTIEYFVSLN